jgi:GNAT superfamily N-acetyltransferase
MGYFVRPAEEGDAGAIGRLYLEVADEVVEREPTLRHVPGRDEVVRRYSQRASDPERAVLVATVDETVAGFADAVLVRTTDIGTYHSPGLDAYIEELIVAEPQRRHGLGRALVRAVEAWAKDSGARLVTLDTHFTNVAARDFYAALGYSEVGVLLHRTI